MTATNRPSPTPAAAPLGRDAFVAAITDFLSDREPAALRQIRTAVSDTIDANSITRPATAIQNGFTAASSMRFGNWVSGKSGR